MARASSPVGDQVAEKLVIFFIFYSYNRCIESKTMYSGSVLGYEFFICCLDLCSIHL